MKADQIETTRLLIREVQNEFKLTQKEIALSLNISESELSKAKNPKAEFAGEISIERRNAIIDLLQELLRRQESGNQPKNALIIRQNGNSEKLETHNKVFQISKTPDNELRKNLVFGCAVSAVIIHTLVVVFKNIFGYESLSIESFNQIVGISFLFHIVFGALLGYMASLVIQRLKNSNSHKFYILYLFTFFISVFIVAGLKARDSYLMCKFTNKDCNGLLGEPNFELLATSLAMTIGGFALVSFILKNSFFSNKQSLTYSLKYAAYCSIVFSLINLFYIVIVKLGLIIDKGHVYNSAIFKFSFSHPERVTLIFLTVFIGLFLTLTFVKYQIASAEKEFIL